MSTVLADLDLPATPMLPRTLSLMLGLLSGHLTAVVTVSHNVMIAASGTGELAESAAMGPVLQIGSARFKLRPEEVEPIRAFLARFPSTEPTIRSDSAKLATPVIPLLDGTSGKTPSSDGSRPGGGTLEGG